MKKYFKPLLLILLISCAEKKEAPISSMEKDSATTSKESKKTTSNYIFIRDNLFRDNKGNLYIKSQNNENIREGIKYDVWLKTVYCDTCWTPTEDGWKDITELKDFVDTATFHLEMTDNKRGAHIYKDKNYRYVHKWMADGGQISLEK